MRTLSVPLEQVKVLAGAYDKIKRRSAIDSLPLRDVDELIDIFYKLNKKERSRSSSGTGR